MDKFWKALIISAALFLGSCQLLDRSQPVSPDATGTQPAVSVAIETETAGPSPTAALAATATATITVSPKLTLTPESAPAVSEAPRRVVEPDKAYRYKVQVGTPVETTNFLYPEAGCNWMGVGGQVFSLEGEPVTGLIVEVSGILDGQEVLYLALTGGSPVLGPGGFEIKLADQPVASEGALTLQLFDLSGEPQTPRVNFDTYAGEGSCERNLILINYTEVAGERYEYIFPRLEK